MNRVKHDSMTLNNKDRIRQLLKGIETGDPKAVRFVNEDKYIQHNPQTHEGSEGLAALFKRLSRTSPRVNVARVFEDGDFVFAHTEYDFARRNIGFEIFRFEDSRAVEHWDNIQKRLGPNSAGHTMVDGETEVSDLGKTESNRSVIRSFVERVLIGGEIDDLAAFMNREEYTEHNPHLGDDPEDLRVVLSQTPGGQAASIRYQKCHRILAEGNFVLSVCEGFANEVPSSFYDLFRLRAGRISEHWDTREYIAPRSEWKNDNGKF